MPISFCTFLRIIWLHTLFCPTEFCHQPDYKQTNETAIGCLLSLSMKVCSANQTWLAGKPHTKWRFIAGAKKIDLNGGFNRLSQKTMVSIVVSILK